MAQLRSPKVNRRGFDKAISECLSNAVRIGKPLCLAVCDIDHFKSFNDQHGHLVGDQAIKFIAKTLKNSLREGDVASRFGGEEFALLLPSTSVEDARVLAERIRNMVASKRIMKRATKEAIGQVTVSIGISSYTTQQNPEDLFQAADKNLYEAKSGGRNHIIRLQKGPSSANVRMWRCKASGFGTPRRPASNPCADAQPPFVAGHKKQWPRNSGHQGPVPTLSPF
jgi:diguanylate cyclase (GGDEF)-like protein